MLFKLYSFVNMSVKKIFLFINFLWLNGFLVVYNLSFWKVLNSMMSLEIDSCPKLNWTLKNMTLKLFDFLKRNV